MEWCSDVFPSVDFSYFHIWSWSSTRVTVRFFFTTLTKAFLHQFLCLSESRLFQTSAIKGNRAYMLLWPFNEEEFFSLTLPQMCGLTQTCFWDLQTVLLTQGLSFLLWYALSAAGPFIKTSVPFQILSIQLNLPQVTFTQSLVTPTSNMNAPELNSNCQSFKSSIFNKFAKMLNFFYFLLYHYSVWSVDWCGK